MRNFTPTRANGWRTAGWIILRRNFTGRSSRTEQSFPVLLNWWAQNPKRRHIWPGLAFQSEHKKWKPDEIPNQIRLTRRQNGASGYILYNMNSLLEQSGAGRQIARAIHREPALVPAIAVAQFAPPGKPKAHRQRRSNSAKRPVVLANAGKNRATLGSSNSTNGVWTTEIFPANRSNSTF